MARADLSSCLACGESVGAESLTSSARGARPARVCPRCFHLRELDGLMRALPAGDSVRQEIEEGLRLLYEVIRARATAVADGEPGDGAQS